MRSVRASWSTVRSVAVFAAAISLLERAISARGTAAGLMFHSDRGVEYAAHRYQGLLQAHSIVPSMNRPYTSQDNAHMESFFHSLKAELLHRREIASEGELIAVLAGYIDRFYNGSSYCPTSLCH